MELGIRAGMEWMAGTATCCRLIAVRRAPTTASPPGCAGASQAAVSRRRRATSSEAIDEGQIPEADPDLLAHAILGVTHHLCATLDPRRPRADATPVVDAAVRFCLGGIRRPRPRPHHVLTAVDRRR